MPHIVKTVKKDCYECGKCGHYWFRRASNPPRRCPNKRCWTTLYEESNTVVSHCASNGNVRIAANCGHCGRPLTGRQRQWCGKACNVAALRGSAYKKDSYHPPGKPLRGKAGDHHPLCACIPCLLLVPKTLKRGSGVKGIGHRVYRKLDGGGAGGSAMLLDANAEGLALATCDTLSVGGGVGAGG